MAKSMLAGLVVCACTAYAGGVAGAPVRVVTGAPSLVVGTLIEATVEDSHVWRRNAWGELLTATVSGDVTNGQHQVVIPAGSAVRLRMTRWAPGATQRDDASITLQVLFVSVRGRQYEAQGRAELKALAVYQGRVGVVVVAPEARVRFVLSEAFSAARADVPQ